MIFTPRWGIQNRFTRFVFRVKNFLKPSSGARWVECQNGFWMAIGLVPNFCFDLFFTRWIWILDAYFVMFDVLRFAPITFPAEL